MNFRVPSKAVAIGGYAVFASLLALLTLKTQKDGILIFLLFPIILASVTYPRAVFWTMLLIGFAASSGAVSAIFTKPGGSLRTVAGVFLVLSIFGEILFRLRRAKDEVEKSLRESELRFRTIFETEPEGVLLLGANGAILDINPAGVRLLQADSAEQARQRSLYSVVPPHELEKVRGLIEANFQSQNSSLEFEILGQRGQPRWIRANSAPFHDASGRVISALLVAREITESKQAETRIKCFSRMAEQLASSRTPREAARTMAEAAQELLGWDACFLQLISQTSNTTTAVLTIDIIDGARQELEPSQIGTSLTPMIQKVVREGPQLILRESPEGTAPNLVGIGDKGRKSASLMFVPVWKENRVIGVFSIQSYVPGQYDQRDLVTLQALANHCGGALARIQETSERARVEEELVRSEMRFRTVVENLGEGLLITDLNDVVLYANSRMRDLCGYAPEELAGQKAYQLIVPPKDWDFLRRQNERRGQGQSETYILELQRKEGGRFWAEIHATPFQTPSGQIIGTIGAIADITERKRSEERLAAFSDLGQRLSANSTPQDAARIVVEAAQELIGWEACTLDLYLADQDIIEPLINIDTIDGVLKEVRHPFAGSKPSAMMRMLMERGGQLILREPVSEVRAPLTPFGDCERRSESLLFVPIRHGKTVIGSLSIQSYTPHRYDREDLNTLQALADICGGAFERMRATRALQQSEERFAKAFRSSPIAIAIHSLKGDRILDVNESLLRLLGYERSQMVGRTASELEIWVGSEVRAQLLECSRAGKSLRDFQCRLRARHGEERDILASAEMIELGGEKCALFIFQDVTERLSLEMQLRHSQKLEAVGQLSAGIAHDFNNILTIILGHASMLLGLRQTDRETRESLQQIFSAAERAANLTAQLLAFSRKQIIQPKPVHLNELIGQASKMLQRLLGENIELQLNYAPQLPLIYADAGLLEQVILNLALNARDAMLSGGKLLIASENVWVRPDQAQANPESRPGNFNCLRMSDTGCGMDEETLSHIFEPFFTTKEVGKGTGLGLATVYGIVKQHQGWIAVESQKDLGTTFRIYLPVCSESAAPVPDHPGAYDAALGGTETILVVDADAALRGTVRRILQRYGYCILDAGGAQEASEVWLRYRAQIRLLLTDVHVPDGPSGWALAEKLQSGQPELKVLYSSGYHLDLKSFHHRLQEGVNFLFKPYNPQTLARLIRTLLDRSSSS